MLRRLNIYYMFVDIVCIPAQNNVLFEKKSSKKLIVFVFLPLDNF